MEKVYIKNIISDKSDEEISLCEERIISDISECKRSKLIGIICQIKINDYKKNNDNEFELIVEFISYFSVKFIFNSEYPLSPPSIIYYSGLKIKNIFDKNGNLLMETIKKENWNKGIWLSTLILYIELLISKEIDKEKNDINQNNINNKKEKYGKRKWEDYLKETNYNYKDENNSKNELDINLKRLK